jgi:hypothetical protein
MNAQLGNRNVLGKYVTTIMHRVFLVKRGNTQRIKVYRSSGHAARQSRAQERVTRAQLQSRSHALIYYAVCAFPKRIGESAGTFQINLSVQTECGVRGPCRAVATLS